jgi:hypothetical protein
MFPFFFNAFLFFGGWCFFSSSSWAEVKGKRYAVLIGISRYKYVNSLRWPAKDVERIRLFLKGRGFQDVDIKVLRDEEATKSAMIAALTWLQKTAGPKDHAFFYFSGHGSQIPDLDGDEEDGKDETLCPYDTNEEPESHLSDDWIEPWLKSFRARKLTVVLDSCFSGGALSSKSVLPAGSLSRHWENPYTKRFFETPQGRLILERARQKATSLATKGAGKPQEASRAIRIARRPKDKGGSSPPMILLTAAQGDQLAWENPAAEGGIFTVMLLRALENDPCVRDLQTLQSSINSLFQKEPFVRYQTIQHPTYTQYATQTPLLSLSQKTHPDHLRVCHEKNACVTLWANQDGNPSTRSYCLVEDQPMYVFVQPEGEARIKLFVRSTKGEVAPLFPNPRQADFLLQTQQIYRFPPQPPTYLFRAKGPKGWMQLIVEAAFSKKAGQRLQPENENAQNSPIKGELRLYVPSKKSVHKQDKEKR